MILSERYQLFFILSTARMRVFYAAHPDSQSLQEDSAYTYSHRVDEDAQKLSEDSPVDEHSVVVIACSADGSIHRSVRKFMRKNSDFSVRGVALLGHARCETSAKQMEDTVYGGGNRFANKAAYVVKTQVELEGPEAKFDPWIEELKEMVDG